MTHGRLSPGSSRRRTIGPNARELCRSVVERIVCSRSRASHGRRATRNSVSNGAGGEIYMPMRVFPNGEGSEVLITVFRRPGMSDEKFAEDTQWVRRDLEALKELLEK